MPESPASGPAPRRRSDTAERILNAAEELFAERGFGATSVGEIAERVGIRPPSLYNHFGSKQELYEAVLDRLFRPFFELLDRLVKSKENSGRAERSIEAAMRHLARFPNLPRLIQHEALAGGEQLERLIAGWYRPVFERAGALIQATPPDGLWTHEERLALTVAFSNMVLGYFTLARLHREVLGDDPLTPEAIERHTAFLCKLSRLLRTERHKE